MPNIERLRRKTESRESVEGIENRQEAANDSIYGEAEKIKRQASLAEEAREQRTHDSQEATGLLQRLKDKYGERYVEQRGLKPGDEVYSEGHFYVIDKGGRTNPEPLVKPEHVELREKELDTELEIATRAGLSGEASRSGGLESLFPSPLERRAREYDLDKNSEERERREEHLGAQVAAAEQTFIAKSIDPEIGDRPDQRERIVRAGDVTKVTPESKEEILKTLGKDKWWKRLFN